MRKCPIVYSSNLYANCRWSSKTFLKLSLWQLYEWFGVSEHVFLHFEIIVKLFLVVEKMMYVLQHFSFLRTIEIKIKMLFSEKTQNYPTYKILLEQRKATALDRAYFPKFEKIRLRRVRLGWFSLYYSSQIIRKKHSSAAG